MEKEEKIKLFSKLITTTGIFAGLVAVILLLNFLQMQKQDPIDSKVIAALVERLDQDPDNETLKLEIRQLDLLARKAYFTSEWQVKTGAFILLFSGLVLGLLLKLQHDLKNKIEEPPISSAEHQKDRKIAALWIWSIGSLILIGALIAAFWSGNQLAHYEEFKLAQAKQQNQTPTDTEEIQVIDLSQKSPQDSLIPNPESLIPNPDSLVPSPESQVPSPESRVPSPDSQVPNPQSTIENQNPTPSHTAFRGPNSNGISPAKNIPTEWDASSGKNIIWKAAIPRAGFNSPIIWKDKIFLAGGDETAREVFCYNRNTGELLWQQEVNNIEGSPAKPPKTTSDTGLSAPTLTTDGKAVFAIFGTGDLIAFDFAGKRLWARNMGVPDNHYGHSSSLICSGNKLIILLDSNKGGKITAVDTGSGSTVWEKARKNKISWSSPVLVEIEGKKVILTTTDPFVAAHDFETGEELWSVSCLMGEVGASAAYGEGLVFGANEYARLVAIRPGPTPEIVWESDEYLPEVASPVVSEGLLFIGTSYGVFACYDAKTGKKNWEFEGNDGYYASPMIADGKVYALSEGGVMQIFELSPEMKLIGEPKLGEKAVATPAFADGRIYLRSNTNLFCIGKK